jgi:filamentous hemagglutinin
VDDLLRARIDKIKRLYPDAKIGYRGSLATGTKYSTGGAFDPKDWDVDAFIVSDELYGKLPAGWKSARDVPEIGAICEDIENQLKILSGYRTAPGKEFTFKVWQEKDFEIIIKSTEHVLF